MVGVDLKSLLNKLNPQCKSALEGAAGLAVQSSHYEVTNEHLLLKLLDDPQNDLAQVFRHFEVETSRVQRACTRVLEGLRSGNSAKPVFSPLLIAWLEEAFLRGGVDYSLQRIRSGTLLLALVARAGRSEIGDYTDELEKIRPDELARELPDIVHGSDEEESASTGDAPLPSRPGTAAAVQAGEEALARFTRDITAAAREGEIEAIVGRDSEIRNMIDVLTRKKKNNPMIVGEAGVGKTAVVEGFAVRVAQGDVPAPLQGVRVLNLDMGLLQAGAGMKGEFENRLKSVINEVQASETPTILFIDEAHTLIGAGGAQGTGDAANLLKPPLARGQLRTIGATTYSEYKKYIEPDPALERRFQPIHVDEPSVELGIVMMRGMKEAYEDHHRVKILDRAVEAAVALSDRYITGRNLPDKAVDLLDTASARVALAQTTKPGRLDDLERRLVNLATAIRALESDAEEALEDCEEQLETLRAEQAETEAQRALLHEKWSKELAAVEKVRSLQGELARARGRNPAGVPSEEEAEQAPPGDPLQLTSEIEKAMGELAALQDGEALVQVYVDPNTVAQVIADWTGIPVGKMVKDDIQRVLTMQDQLCERVVGQDHAIASIVQKVKASKAGVAMPDQPTGVFLLVGPSGVGKTETGLALADILFGGERFMTTINMSEFMEKHTVSRLIGSPPGYVGYGEGGELTEAVRHRPYQVVLLDEIEKADAEVMNLFYQVFDKGTLSDGEGREVDFRNTILLMTSNLGSDVLMEAAAADDPPAPEELVERIRPVLQQYLKPALLGRMTVLPYYPLSPEMIRVITEQKLKKVGRLLADNHDMDFVVTREARDALADRCTDFESGARNIDQMIAQHVMPRISQSLLEKMGEEELPLRLTLDADTEGGLTFAFSDD